MKTIVRYSYLSVFLAILLISCFNFPEQGKISTAEHFSPVAPIDTPHASPQPTSTLVSLDTNTPIQTLTVNEVEKKTAELMLTNGNCKIPCFWQITPGVSKFNDTVIFLDSLGKEGRKGIEGNLAFYANILNYKEVVTLGIGLTGKDELVESLKVSVKGIQQPSVESEDWLAFRPDEIIRNYGTPSIIQVGFWEGQNGYISYQLLMSYNTSSFQLLYSGEDSVYRPRPILHACPLSKNGIGSFELTIGKMIEIPSNYMYPIDRVSSLSTDEFSKLIISDNELPCIDFDLSLFYK